MENIETDDVEKRDLYEGVNVPRSFDDRDSNPVNVSLMMIGSGLEKYAKLFQDENIGMDVLSSLNAEDLRAIGITDEADIRNIVSQFHFDKSAKFDDFILTAAEDSMIINGMLNQTNQLGSAFQKIAKSLKKTDKKPKDFRLCQGYSQLDVLDTIVKETIAITRENVELLYNSKNREGLVTDIVKAEKLKLPGFLKKKLAASSLQFGKKRFVFRLIRLVTVVSIATLCTAYFLKRCLAYGK